MREEKDFLNDITNMVFDLIYKKYQETHSDEVVIEFPFEIREQRTEVGTELTDNGYIVKFGVYGKRFFSCILTQSTINLFNER